MTITDDNQFEANEMFSVVARENPPSYSDIQSFVIQSDTVIITIEDTDRTFYAFEGCILCVVIWCEAPANST